MLQSWLLFWKRERPAAWRDERIPVIPVLTKTKSRLYCNYQQGIQQPVTLWVILHQILEKVLPKQPGPALFPWMLYSFIMCHYKADTVYIFHRHWIMGFTELGNWLGVTWSQIIPFGKLQYHLKAKTFLIGPFQGFSFLLEIRMGYDYYPMAEVRVTCI